MKLLITGGCGFLGSNLADDGLSKGLDICVFDNLSRLGSEKNLDWLKNRGKLKFVHGDIRNHNDVERVVRQFQPDVVFHLAGQVAMTTSLENPRLDFETNVGGSLNLLEAVRNYCPETVIVYSSTNKVYGDLDNINYIENETRYELPDFPHGLDESISLDFRSPYGCSKGSADQYMQDYYRNYGVKTVVFRHSSIFGTRQFSTYDQGWIGWFIHMAIESKRNANHKFVISGTGKQVRDILFSSDLINCYYSAIKDIKNTAGEAFNIGGGAENSLSLLELFQFLERKFDCTLNYNKMPWRTSDQKVFVADIRKIKGACGWRPLVDKNQGLDQMISWITSQ